ncbi:branched-chain amino acid ABC transporter permease [Pseudomonas japonica]|uniref:Amino acid/amide ABC transporter membrane protein 1, HAAT family n=1 Tax=Pseudomonas japonica TaxID=256466 RepID=A0A239JHA9_9PSED|nr:branched-chain amino acid ABC transporter permease [Pseudomonas japonica]SNT05197.1 amino acid/amide ABC transporter membrane protein 1, HAAT family [Pseudomonas japonica]
MPSLVIILNSLASGVLLGATLALAALGLSIVLGVMRLVNLAHGELLLIGAYLGYYLLRLTGLDPILCIPLIAILAAAAVYPLERLLVAPLINKGMEAGMMTMFGLSIIAQNLFLMFFSADTRSIDIPYAATALHLGPLTISSSYAIGCGISLCAIALVYWVTEKTAFGRELRASSADPVIAQVHGVNVRRVRSMAFALGAGCAALSGVLIGTAFSFTPSSGASYLLTAFTVVVLGGLGSIRGTLFGGITLGVLQSVGAMMLGDGYRDLVGLVLFIAVLTFRPTGIMNRGTA